MIKIKDLEPKNDPMGGAPFPPGDYSSYPDDRPPTPYPPYRMSDITPSKGLFHDIQFRDLLYAVSMVTVALVFLFQRASNLAGLNETVKQLSLTVATQQKLIDTNSSDIRMQNAHNLEQDKQLGEAQQQLLTLVPGMVEIRTKLNFVADLMDRQSKQRNP